MRGVNALLDTHIGHVAERIAELRSLEGQLKALRDKCSSGRSVEPCGVLQGLGGAPQTATHPAAIMFRVRIRPSDRGAAWETSG